MKQLTTSSPRDCPRCGGCGLSVAALDYAETARWHSSGSFSAIGLAGGGLGIGIGSFSGQGEMRSKRAEVFSEPTRYTLPATVILVVGGVLALAFLNLSSLAEMTAEAPPSGSQGSIGSNIASTAADLSPALWLLATVLALLVFAAGLRGYWQAEAEEARLNAEVLPRQIERYNQLRYCENCHVLFDPDGRSEPGSEPGFQRMMNNTTWAGNDG